MGIPVTNGSPRSFQFSCDGCIVVKHFYAQDRSEGGQGRGATPRHATWATIRPQLNYCRRRKCPRLVHCISAHLSSHRCDRLDMGRGAPKRRTVDLALRRCSSLRNAHTIPGSVCTGGRFVERNSIVTGWPQTSAARLDNHSHRAGCTHEYEGPHLCARRLRN